jgi:hypothetical protein
MLHLGYYVGISNLINCRLDTIISHLHLLLIYTAYLFKNISNFLSQALGFAVDVLEEVSSIKILFTPPFLFTYPHTKPS